jgi:hypothetical protein
MSVIDKLKLGFKDVDSIYESTSHKWDDKKKVDTLLEIGAIIEANLGIDSTIGERNEAKKQQRYIYRTIKKIDPSLGDLLMRLF